MYSMLYFGAGFGFVAGVLIYVVYCFKLAADIEQGQLKVKEQSV